MLQDKTDVDDIEAANEGLEKFAAVPAAVNVAVAQSEAVSVPSDMDITAKASGCQEVAATAPAFSTEVSTASVCSSQDVCMPAAMVA